MKYIPTNREQQAPSNLYNIPQVDAPLDILFVFILTKVD